MSHNVVFMVNKKVVMSEKAKSYHFIINQLSVSSDN
jgi:hypothetical protein